MKHPEIAWIIASILAVLFAAMLVHGIHTGDADYVRKNAQNFCFG